MNPPIPTSQIQIGGRFIPRSLVIHNNSALTEAFRTINDKGGGATGLALNVSNGLTPWNAAHPLWRDTLFDMVLFTQYNYQNWDANLANQELMTRELVPQLARLTPHGGAYLSEADFQQPGFQKTLYGSNYPMLRAIKTREAPKTAASISKVLDALIDTLKELLSVLVSGQGKHTEPHHDLPLETLTLSDAASDTASLSSDQSQPQSELEELLRSCDDTISCLFRSSVLIYSATSRNRDAKAAAAGDPFSEHYDIDHVGPDAAAGHSHHSESDSVSRTSDTDRQNHRLHVAAFEGLEDEIVHLLREGALITEPGKTWGNVLTAAIVGGHPSVVQLLLNHGARIDLHARSFGLPLEAAISQGDDAVLEMLRRAEEVEIPAAASAADITVGDTDGYGSRCTRLIQASNKGDTEAVILQQEK
ncbi:MAG: hypothetical protein Q9193_003932 [Seirophora villosa]